MTEPTGEKKNRAGNLVLAAALLPVVYLLSIGPAGLIPSSNPVVNDWIQRLYRPVEWIYNGVPMTRKPIESYMNWWMSWSSP